MRKACFVGWIGLSLAVWAVCDSSSAQDKRYEVLQPGQRRKSTVQQPKALSVTVELLMGKDSAALKAQEWGQAFDKLGVPVRIRQAAGEKPEIREQKVGTSRQVTAIGRLDRGGTIIFPEQSFTLGDVSKLAEWLASLDTYGAQGSPEGKPVWGLSEAQFGDAYALLSQALDEPVEGLELQAALEKFTLAPKLPLRMSAETSRWLEREFSEPRHVQQEFQGFSKGTALALLLGEYGLAFHPARTAAGGIELVVDPAGVSADVWPAGWEPKESRQKTAPQLFQMFPVEFDDVPLLDLADVIAERSKVPIVWDLYRIEQSQVDLGGIRVSHPRKNSFFEGVVDRVIAPAKLRSFLRIDELGHPLLWITTLEHARADR